MLHPDVPGTGDTEAFVAIKRAYDVLANPALRAAYDRAARRSIQEDWEPGVIPPPRAAPIPPIPTRQPRASDLPWPVWAGLGLVLLVGIVQVVRHLTALPALPTGSVILARAPTVAAAAPPRPLAIADANAPARLSGTPNAFVVPAAGSTVLWHRDEAHDAFLPIGQLPPFTSVQALRMFRQTGLMEIRTTETATGFIEASRLTPGNEAAARRAYCGYHAGPAPENGEVLQRQGTGPGQMEIDNRTSQPAVIKLLDPRGVNVATTFIAPGAHAVLDHLPDDRYRPAFATGELWSRGCQTFTAGMRAQRFSGYFSLTALTPLSIPPDLPGESAPTDISDDAFERE